VRVVPHGLEAGTDFRPGKVVEPDAVAARVGKGRIAAAGAGEFGVELDDVADIDDDQEGRAAFIRRQVAGVVLGLAAGAQHGVVEHAGLEAGADFLDLADEGGAPVAVDEAVAGAAVAVVKNDAALEDVGVVAGVFVGRLGFVDFHQLAEIGDEKPVVGALGAAGIAPAGEEGVDLHDGGILARRLRSTAKNGRFSRQYSPMTLSSAGLILARSRTLRVPTGLRRRVLAIAKISIAERTNWPIPGISTGGQMVSSAMELVRSGMTTEVPVCAATWLFWIATR